MSVPIIIENFNLSTAWLTVLERIIESSGTEISPLVLTLTDFSEVDVIRDSLNTHLERKKFYSIETVSQTIFPNSLYNLHKDNREEFCKAYLNVVLPRFKKIAPANNRGTYFERLIDYGDSKKVNQLEIIIRALKDKKTRRSKLQASIFDPNKDHLKDAYQKFPCLQHVTFFKSENGGLVINGFYAVQFLYQKAYGNWLGLINLGKFVAAECGLELERFNCFIGVEQLENKINKGEAKKLLSQMQAKSV